MKDYIRDYATAAFWFYAKNGKSAEKYKEQIYNQVIEEMNKKEVTVKDGVSKPIESIIMAAEKAVDEKIAEIKDMEAVEKVLAEFNSSWKYRHIVHVIEQVYFKEADKEISLGDIQNRVIAASIDIPASERSIYYWLRKARELFAYHRGLRI